MLGFAQCAAMSDPAKKVQVIEQNMRIGRFLHAVGGRYITHLFEPRPNPNVSEDKIFQSMPNKDFRTFASTANELGKRLREETGIRIAYHAEGEEVKAGILHRIMEMTNLIILTSGPTRVIRQPVDLSRWTCIGPIALG